MNDGPDRPEFRGEPEARRAPARALTVDSSIHRLARSTTSSPRTRRRRGASWKPIRARHPGYGEFYAASNRRGLGSGAAFGRFQRRACNEVPPDDALAMNTGRR
jgi:hypothetical protein